MVRSPEVLQVRLLQRSLQLCRQAAEQCRVRLADEVIRVPENEKSDSAGFLLIDYGRLHLKRDREDEITEIVAFDVKMIELSRRWWAFFVVIVFSVQDYFSEVSESLI
jgi:hypothetical protein